MSRSRIHTYDVEVTWTGNIGAGTAGYRSYERAHEVRASGRTPILGSSDPVFRGDPSRWNPEQLLVASASQCHMLWYLHLAGDAGVVVVAYRDEARGTMEEAAGGGGRFTEVVLRPHVLVAEASMVAPAAGLHPRAHERCYIASSLNVPVTHRPVTEVAT
jgi:organic hydroperoxide reductase OsmC/OhrA